MNYNDYKKKRMSNDERLAVMAMDMMYNSVLAQVDKLDGRLRDYKGLKRDLGMLKWIFSNITARSLTGLPSDVIAHTLRQAKDFQLDIVRRGPARQTRNEIVMPIQDMQTLFGAIICDHCATCMKSANEAQECPLRRLMIKYVDEPESAMNCGYSSFGMDV